MASYRTQFEDGSGMYLTKAMVASKMRQTEPPAGWRKHTPYHWSIDVAGKRLDFWPTKDGWIYDGVKYHGDVDDFIAAKEQANDRL